VPNLFDPFSGSAASAAAPLDGMRNPIAFASAVAEGLIDTSNRENVQACVLRENEFYLQRPPHPNTYHEAFRLVKVIKCIPSEEEGQEDTQYGAWVQTWQLGTQDTDTLNRCFFTDPWWANSKNPSQCPYNNNLAIGLQTWAYTKSALSEFQVALKMKKWKTPKGWQGDLVGGKKAAFGVEKKALCMGEVAKVRAFIMRWNNE
jgi:hypothetical protein